MPIEIRELVIRAIVEPAAGSSGPGAAPPTAGAAGPASVDPDLVQECVAEVMRQLRRAGEP